MENLESQEQDTTSVGTQIPILPEISLYKIRQYHTDYDNRPSNSISFIPAIEYVLGVYTVNFKCTTFILTGSSGNWPPFLQPERFNLHNMTVVIYTGLRGGLEHLKIETRSIDERFESVMGEYVI